MVRAKFKLTTKEPNGNGDRLVFEAVYGDGKENKEWSKWTPSGQLEMFVTNPAALDQFQLGESYYLDFSPAPFDG